MRQRMVEETCAGTLINTSWERDRLLFLLVITDSQITRSASVNAMEVAMSAMSGAASSNQLVEFTP